LATEQPFNDRVSLVGLEADIYEAIATLEFLGRPVTGPDIAAAARLDQAVVDDLLHGMTERAVVNVTDRDGAPAYEPAYRGWSTVPEQSAGPRR